MLQGATMKIQKNHQISDLNQILGRLRAMIDATDNQFQSRRFDVFGIEEIGRAHV